MLISTRRPNIFSGDLCKQIGHAYLSIPSRFEIFVASSLSHASDQSNTSNRHDKYSFSICGSEGNDFTECIKRLRHSIVLILFFSTCSVCLSFLFLLFPASLFPLFYKSCSLSIGKASFRPLLSPVSLTRLFPRQQLALSLWIFLPIP